MITSALADTSASRRSYKSLDTPTAAPTNTQSQEVDLQSALSDIRNQRAQATL